MRAAHVDLIVAAIRVAQSAPKRQGTYSVKATVDWRLIHELRAAIGEAGIDWETGKLNDEVEDE